jgi:hypothetical protein
LRKLYIICRVAGKNRNPTLGTKQLHAATKTEDHIQREERHRERRFPGTWLDPPGRR